MDYGLVHQAKQPIHQLPIKVHAKWAKVTQLPIRKKPF
jgi:hypothetical protein